jgi:hypothetical protein
MGIYIVKSLHSDWIKIGHHKITDKRPSVYYRFINRGFYSTYRPPELKDKVSFNDVELIYWFENLNMKDEKKLHKKLRTLYYHIGEWYKYENIDNIINVIHEDYNVISKMPTIEDYNDARKWCDKLHKNSKILNLCDF